MHELLHRRPVHIFEIGAADVSRFVHRRGCVPVVIDKAGQKEIITPGANGFRWQSPEQLKELTARVAGDEKLRLRLSEAAIKDSAAFSDEAFAGRWQRIASSAHLLD